MAQTIKDVVTWLKQWYYTEDEVDDLLDEKQDSLVSGTNIKTINNNSLLGSGNINIQGSGGDGSLTKITLADGYDLYVNDNNHLAMLHIHKSVSLSGQWNTLLASAIPLAYRPLGWLGIPNNDDNIVVGDDGGIYYNNFSGSSSKTLDNQVNWFFVGGTSSYNVALTSNKSILSYYDSESAILTATVTDASDNPVADVTVEFFNGSTSMGTADTNSSGVATKTYASTGAGDLSFTASVGTIVSEIYSLVDAVYALSTEQTLTSTATTDRFTAMDDNLSLTLPSSFELSFKLKNNNITSGARFGIVPVRNKTNGNPQRSLFGQQKTNNYVGVYRDTATHAVGSDTSTTGTEYHDWKIVRDGNTFKWYFDGVQINSDITLSWFDNYAPHLLGWQYWKSGTANVKDIIIKPL